jgi:hypothetical protein
MIVPARDSAARGRPLTQRLENQPLCQATHQLRIKIGMVAPSAHQRGRMKSAPRPRTENVSQNIFRSKHQVYSLWVRDSSTPFWQWMNLLSLDAPVLALVWQDYLARCYPSLLRPAGRWVLGLTVWVIYIADRLIDVRRPAMENEPIRHRFYRQNRGLAKVVLTSVAFADLFIALLWLRPAVFSNGLLIGAGVVCYLVVSPSRGWQR